MSNEAVPSLEWAVARMLRVGVILSGVMMFVGWMTFMNFHENPLLQFHEYQNLRLITALTQAWQTGNWGLILSYAGLALLVSLPVIRVFMTAILFTKQGQKTLAGLAYFVFFILIVSLTLGIDL
jgi:uncharacterized membrane protein